MTLDDYISLWNLSNPQLIANTHTSDVYRVLTHDGIIAVLKFLNDKGERDEANGAVALEHFNGHGAIKLLNKGKKAHLLEYASSESLSSVVQMGNDATATDIIAQTVKRLHSCKAPYSIKLVSLEIWLNELFEQAARDKVSGTESIYVDAAATATELFQTQTKTVLLHGDVHHDNIMNSERGWLAIDPKGLIGDPAYDVANIFGNPMGMEDLWLDKKRINRLADIFSSELNLGRTRILKFAFVHNTISYLWSGGTEVSRSGRLELAHCLKSMI